MVRATRGSAAREAAFIEASKQPSEPQQLSSPPQTPTAAKKSRSLAGKVPKPTPRAKKVSKTVDPLTAVTTGKRKRAKTVKTEEDPNELPHNLGKLPTSGSPQASKAQASPAKRTRKVQTPEVKDEPVPTAEQSTRVRRTRKVDAKKELQDPAAIAAAEKLTAAVEDTPDGSPSKKTRKAKANPYGLTPGQTPYPDWPHPRPEECQEVVDLLSKVHGPSRAPAMIPAPSTSVSGCGEVPSILDALIRTLLSAATTGTNSSRAFKGLVDTFGVLQEGIGKGSVDWDKVRRADRKEVFEAIKSGGLAVVKSQRIQEILNMVHDENIARREALEKSKAEDDHSAAPRGAENESKADKEAEIARADEHVLSLDHLHLLSSDEALNALIKYPGIGPKTASCVLLFCMQRPSFAVDTHVFRLCKWLNWVPPTKASRNTTYSHCEVRIPDNLKYPLHQLMIRHGKTCPRCRAATGVGSEDWEKGCPIEHLVTRTGTRKGGAGAARKRTKKGKKSEDSDEESEMEMDDTEEEEDGAGDDDEAEDSE